MRTVNPFDVRKSTNGFQGNENEKKYVESVAVRWCSPADARNLFGFFVLLPINFEMMHDLVFWKKVGILFI